MKTMPLGGRARANALPVYGSRLRGSGGGGGGRARRRYNWRTFQTRRLDLVPAQRQKTRPGLSRCCSRSIQFIWSSPSSHLLDSQVSLIQLAPIVRTDFPGPLPFCSHGGTLALLQGRMSLLAQDQLSNSALPLDHHPPVPWWRSYQQLAVHRPTMPCHEQGYRCADCQNLCSKLLQGCHFKHRCRQEPAQ
jgi:hypothetical protein